MAKRTFNELIDAVQRKDFEPRADILSMIIDWLNDAHLKIARHDLKCFEASSSYSIGSSTNKYSIATLCPSYRKMITTFREGQDISFNDISRYDLVISGDTSTGGPTDIAEYEGYFYFYPYPDTSYTIYFKYYKVPDRLTGSALDLAKYFLIPSEYEELAVNYAKAVYDFREKDWAAVDRAKAEFERDLRTWRIAEQELSRSQTSQIETERQAAYKLKRRY